MAVYFISHGNLFHAIVTNRSHKMVILKEKCFVIKQEQYVSYVYEIVIQSGDQIKSHVKRFI